MTTRSGPTFGWLASCLAISMGCQSTAPTAEDQSSDGDQGQGGAGCEGCAPDSEDSGLAGAGVITPELTLDSLAARVAGRTGANLSLEATASVPDGSFASLEVTLIDADGNAIEFFDSDWDGVPDATTGFLVPEVMPSGENAAFSLVLAAAGQLPDLDSVMAAVVDQRGRRSSRQSVSVTPLSERSLDESCDKEGIENRCSEGLSCSDDPARCTAAAPPTIERAAYLRHPGGPYLLVRGVDPDDDVMLVRIEFLSSAGQPISLDLDSDGTLDADRFEAQLGIVSNQGGYDFFDQAGEGFDSLVPKVALTAIDSRGNESATKEASLESQTVRVAGQTCESLGFDVCAPGSVCLKGVGNGTARCTTLASARSDACNKAPEITLFEGRGKVTGRATGAGLWNGPDGCLPAIAQFSPDRVFVLNLDEDARHVKLSTAEPETNVDTGLFVQSACDPTESEILACNDDARNLASELELTDVPAGRYYVVVAAIQATGGSFGLSVTVE